MMNESSRKSTSNTDTFEYSLAEALQEYKVGNIPKVELILNKILQKNPDCTAALKLMAMLAHTNNDLDRAILTYQQIISQIPHDISTYVKLSWAYHQQRKFYRAINIYEQIIEIDPNNIMARWRRSLLFLKTGNFQKGLPDFECRRTLPYYQDSYLQDRQIWDGSQLNDQRILLYHSNDGFGDIIQLIRYVPLVKQKGGEVIVAAPESLLRLFSYIDGIDRLVSLTAELPDFDVYIPLFSLPYRFKTTIKTIPNRIPYICLPQPHQASQENLPYLPKTIPETKLKIGIVWSTGHRDRNNTNSLAYRDCPVYFFIDLLSISDVSLYSLQVGTWASEIDEFKDKNRLYDLTPHIQNFADTAVLVSQLDLVISVDTAVAHLAGAMGIPIWILLGYDADWRWLIDRDDSPWYPSMRLFRQPKYGDWKGVFEQVKLALKNI